MIPATSKKIEQAFCKEKEIKNLINSILSIKRQKGNEHENESPEIKLGRRLVQRSFKKLSEQILDYLIERYDIDNKRLPTKEELIDIMIKFLGNIQKAPDNYNLKNEKSEIVFDNSYSNSIGRGLYGQVYKFKLDSSQTKKKEKYLAYKKQVSGIPYPIEVHFTSAELLVIYGFQPKYYNQLFMEIGSYENKNKERVFHNVSQNFVIFNAENIIGANIKWYILFNFVNISDQIHNIMKLIFNNELIKIDLRCLNTEKKYSNSSKYIFCLERYRYIFARYKNEVINELDKLLALKEEFLINFIKFRTERGGFNVSNEDLAKQIGYISSCYKVLNISKKDKLYFEKFFFENVKNFNTHFEINPTFTWMLYLLFKFYILTKNQYIDYINKFNNKSKNYDKIAMIVREGKYSFISQQQNEEEEINQEIENDNNTKEACEEDIKKEEIKDEGINEEKKEKIKNRDIKEETKEENIKREVDDHNEDKEKKEEINDNNDILEINEKIDNTIENEENNIIKEKVIKKIQNSLSYINKNRGIKSDFKLKINNSKFKSSNNIIKEINKKKRSIGKPGKKKKHKIKHKTNNIKLAKPKFAINKIIFSNIITESSEIKDISRNSNNLYSNNLCTENSSEINSNKLPTKKKKYKKLDLSYNFKKVSGLKK